jgi:hypothetical protein
LEIALVGIGSAHDLGKQLQCRVIEVEFGEKGVEGAIAAVMAELDARDIEWKCTLARCDRGNVFRRYEKNLGVRIDEPAD